VATAERDDTPRVNPRLATIEPSLIRAIASKRRATSIDLGLGEPTILPQQRFIDAAARWVREHGVKYTANAGEATLRAHIATHYAYPGMDDARNVCVTNGSQEAMYVAIKTLLDPACDEILVVEPAYPAYAKIAQLEGIAVRSFALPAATDFAFDVDAIIAALSPATRLVIIGSPSNPTGRVLTRGDAQRLAAALGARAGAPVWVLHDELYRELTYVADAGAIGAMYPYTIAVNGLSKSNALTGMRIGWTIAPAPLCDEIVKVHAWLTSTASTFGQRIALGIFDEPGALGEQAAWYRTQRDAILDVLRAAGLRFALPEGAFYVCVQPPGVTDSLAAALTLIERDDVVTIPGRTFAATLEGWLRLSWVAPVDAFREGVRRIVAFAHGAV
jgi:aspartate/methionine/tyrosine aminotransferase